MNLLEYFDERDRAGYSEHISYKASSEISLRSFLNYTACDLEVTLRLAKVLITRHFEPSGSYYDTGDIEWFIKNFLEEFEKDLIKPWISGAIKQSINMILSDEIFTNGIIATSFMFGVIEFYAKYRLGWRPEQYSHFDNQYHDKYRDMPLGRAIINLKKIKLDLSMDLCEIDSFNVSLLKANKQQEGGYTKSRIADRLTMSRNSMVHGESHSFYNNISKYLVMLYILFHFHGLKDGFKYEGL